VFPLRPGDKRPAVRNWETRATADPERITRAWTAGPFNIGIACGPSRLVVIDLDRPKPGAVPPPACRQRDVRDGGDVLAMLCEALDQPLPVDTYTVRTGSGGTHLYFTAPAGVTLRNTAGRLGWLIDTRAAGGYVVACGSIVAGRAYSAPLDIEAMPLPGWLTEQLTEPQATPDPAASPAAAGNPNAYAAAALRGELDRVLIAQAGQPEPHVERGRVFPRPACRCWASAAAIRPRRAHPCRAGDWAAGPRVCSHHPLRPRLRPTQPTPERERARTAPTGRLAIGTHP
jgi:bifunctional DNA primase/polymerase-like protein